MALSFSSFSNCSAMRLKEISRLPEASPASAMVMKMPEKISRRLAMAAARESPFSMPVRHSATASRRRLFSVCAVSISSASTTGTPALMMLTNWRQKTAMSRALGFLFRKLSSISLPRAPVSAMEATVRPPLRSSSRALSRLSEPIEPFVSLPFLSMAT